jgi:hypothetical protein
VRTSEAFDKFGSTETADNGLPVSIQSAGDADARGDPARGGSSMRRALGFAMAAALLAVAIGAAPAAAATRGSVVIDVETTFDDLPDDFTASGLGPCTAGTTVNGPAKIVFTPPAVNIFAGYKVFACAGSDTGFVLRLNARFGPGGSVGTWSVVDSWGALTRMHGAGSLTGDNIENGILDHYRGTLTFN